MIAGRILANGPPVMQLRVPGWWDEAIRIMVTLLSLSTEIERDLMPDTPRRAWRRHEPGDDFPGCPRGVFEASKLMGKKGEM